MSLFFFFFMDIFFLTRSFDSTPFQTSTFEWCYRVNWKKWNIFSFVNNHQIRYELTGWLIQKGKTFQQRNKVWYQNILHRTLHSFRYGLKTNLKLVKVKWALALKEVFHLFKIVTKKIDYLGRQNGWDSLFDGFVRLFDISLIILASRGQSRI